MTTYLVTGANRGIGLEICRFLKGRGDRVIAAVRDPSKGGLEADKAVRVDVADPASIEALGAQVGEPIDILINNAGVSTEQRTLEQQTAQELHRVFGINAFSPLLITKALLPDLRKGTKRVVMNVSSQLGSVANNTGGSSYPYRASKTALNCLTVCLANELKPENFAVVAVHPGWVRTDMGGPNAPMTPPESAQHLVALADRLTAADTGKFLNFDGKPMPW